jgi:hypothetical protein
MSSAVIFVSSGAICFPFICVPAVLSYFLPSSTDSFFFLSSFMYSHTSLSVLISFIFSAPSPPLLLLFSTSLFLYLLSLLGTCFCRSCSSFFSQCLLFQSFTFSVLPSIFPSCPFCFPDCHFLDYFLQMLLFLVSCCTLQLFIHPILLLSPSSAPPLLFLVPFLRGSFVLYLLPAGDGPTLLSFLF